MEYSYEKLVSFYKEIGLYDEEKFNKIQRKIKRLPHSSKGYDFYGVFPKINKNGLLENFVICAPNFSDVDTFLINVHEFAHGLYLMENINKTFKTSCMDEMLPKAIERIYLIGHEKDEVIKSYNDKDIKTLQNNTSINHKNAILMQFLIAKEFFQSKRLSIPEVKDIDDKSFREQIIKTYLKNC